MSILGRGWRSFLGLDAEAEMTFADSEPRPVERVIYEMTNGSVLLPKVGREAALSVPSVMRARDQICSIATLPLVCKDKDNNVHDNRLLRQIDPVRTNVKVLALTLEDLFFEGLSWWHVLERGSDAYPVSAEYVEAHRVSETVEGGRVVRRLDGERVRNKDLILFESPKPGLLHYAGRPIRRALDLDQTASLYADNPRPLDYFTPTDNADPASDEEITDMIRQWREARRVSATAYVPAALKYNEVETPTPQELQLVEMAKQVSLEIANMTGLDPADLGLSVNRDTYQNAQDKWRDRINNLLSFYMRAITDRLSMGDITKTGYFVAFDLNDYMKADPMTRVQVAEKQKAMGALTVDEYRKDEGRPPLSAEQMLQIRGQQAVRVPSTLGQEQRQIGAGDNGQV